jgi:hypothetical protein
MFIGHFGLGLAAKKATPETSLGTLWLAAQFLDLLWPLFLLAGLERVEIDPGNTAVTPLDFVSYPFSHSLLSAVGWGCLFAGIYWLVTHKGAATFWVWALVLSHWVLDAVAHRPDLPLYPGSSRLVGLGLWNSRPATLFVEITLFVWGVMLYRQATRPRDAVGVYGFRTLVVFLALVYLGSIFGPPPPSPQYVAMLGLSQWLLIPWAYWVDRHRFSATG